MDRSTHNVEQQKAFGRDMLAFRMQERLKITTDFENFAVDCQLAGPTKATKQAEDSRQLQETARQNEAKAAAKPMGGGGRHM